MGSGHARTIVIAGTIAVASALLAGIAIFAFPRQPAQPSGGMAVASGTWGTPSAPADAPAQPGLPDVETMIMKLALRLQTTPDDAEGWRMLGWSYVAIGRHPDALKPYEKAIALDGNVARYRSGYGEALVGAANGTVTPAARTEFKRAVQLDPRDFRARYFLGLAKRQDGDARGAYDDWSAIAREAPPDMPWLPDVHAQMVSLGSELGQANSVPPNAPRPAGAAPGASRGPNAADIKAAGRMSAGERTAMIRGMVQRLADRLAQNPRDYQGWIKLARSRMVLGEEQAAREALARARREYAGSPPVLRSIDEAAAALGLGSR